MEPRAQVKEAVRHCPRESGDHASLGTTKRVRHCMSTHCGIEDGRARVRQLLHALGFRRRRRRHRHLQAKPEAPAAFRAALAALRAEWPEDCALIFVDEATVRRHPTLTAQWWVVEEVPAVPTGDDPTKGQGYGAGAPLTGRTHDHGSPELGPEDCAPFLRHLLVYDPRKRLLVIHDRGQPHKGTCIEAVVRGAAGRLGLTPPPADSPELNPQERHWKWLRRVVTPQQWCATRREHIEAMRHVFRYLAGVQDQGRRLCGFKTPESFVASL